MLTLGKTLIETAGPQSISRGMKTDVEKAAAIFGECIMVQFNQDGVAIRHENPYPDTSFLIKILRDFVSKQSVLYLRYHTRHHPPPRYQLLPWWSKENAAEVFNSDLVEYVRGGWPSVPMFWSYATLLELLWENTPIVILTETLSSLVAKSQDFIPKRSFQYLNPNRSHNSATTAWVIQGCVDASKEPKKPKKGKVHVDHILFSAADHPQYPIETNTESYRKMAKADTEELKAGLREEFVRPLKGYEGKLDHDLVLDLLHMQDMRTENKEHGALMHAYREFRKGAAANGCSIVNPSTFVIQHVYVDNVHWIVGDPDFPVHSSLDVEGIRHCILSFL
jgi:hypothetical protein